MLVIPAQAHCYPGKFLELSNRLIVIPAKAGIQCLFLVFRA